MIKGFTDSIGNPQYNQHLSEERAKSVWYHLIKMGFVAEDKAAYQGLGDRNAIADNSDEKGRARNRRVEIIIIPD